MRLLNEKLKGTSEAGNAPIIIAILFSIIAGGTVYYARGTQQSKMQSQLVQVKRHDSQVLNEAALELVAQLAGTTAIVREGDGFKVGAGLGRKTTGLWRLKSPKLIEVYSCDPFLPEEASQAIYGAENDKLLAANCHGRNIVTTSVQVVKFYKGREHAFKAIARTVWDTKGDSRAHVATKARIRIPTIKEQVERSDVCKFMEVQKAADGSVRYAADGSPYLQPKTGWKEDIQLPVNTDLYADVNSPGLKNLSNTLVAGNFQDDDQMTILDLSEWHSMGISEDSDRTQFIGFLAGGPTPVKKWPADGLRNGALKRGCVKTLQNHTSDFCTKAMVKERKITFDQDGRTIQRDVMSCVYFFHNNVNDPKTCSRTFGAYCRNQDGCFSKNTMVRMFDGGERSIDTLKAGELLFNPVTRGPSKIGKVIVGREPTNLLEIKTASGTLEVTANHPFSAERGMLRADQLKVGDQIWNTDLSLVAVTSIRTMESVDEMVWNLALDTNGSVMADHMILANGVVTGDWHIQQLLDKGDLKATRSVIKAMKEYSDK